jgi:hypothetical protein
MGDGARVVNALKITDIQEGRGLVACGEGGSDCFLKSWVCVVRACGVAIAVAMRGVRG